MPEVPKCINPKYREQDCPGVCFLRPHLEGRAAIAAQISKFEAHVKSRPAQFSYEASPDPADLVAQLTDRLTAADNTIALLSPHCELVRQDHKLK